MLYYLDTCHAADIADFNTIDIPRTRGNANPVITAIHKKGRSLLVALKLTLPYYFLDMVSLRLLKLKLNLMLKFK